MRIAQILPTIAKTYGGPVAAATLLHRSFNEHGHESILLPRVTSQTHRFLGTTIYWPGVCQTVEIAREVRGADIVHVHGLWTLPSVVGGLTARATHRPYIVSIHGMLNEWSLAQHPLRKQLHAAVFERSSLREAVVHVLTSQELRRAREWGVDAPIFLIPNGVECEKYGALPDRSTLEVRYPEVRGRAALLFLGRLTMEKGIDLLLEGFARANRTHAALHLFLAGPGNQMTIRRLRRTIARLGIEGHVTFTGEVRDRDKLELLGGCSLFVQLSWSEGDSVALKEAMASGLPALVSTAAATGDFLRAGSGMVVGRRPTEVAEAMCRLLSDPERTRRMGEQGRAWAEKHLDYSSTSARMLRVYHDVVYGTRLSRDWCA